MGGITDNQFLTLLLSVAAGLTALAVLYLGDRRFRSERALLVVRTFEVRSAGELDVCFHNIGLRAAIDIEVRVGSQTLVHGGVAAGDGFGVRVFREQELDEIAVGYRDADGSTRTIIRRIAWRAGRPCLIVPAPGRYRWIGRSIGFLPPDPS